MREPIVLCVLSFPMVSISPLLLHSVNLYFSTVVFHIFPQHVCKQSNTAYKRNHTSTYNWCLSLLFVLLISAPRLGVYYFLSLTLSVRISVCHGETSNCFFFVSRWNRAILWPLVAFYKTVFFDFWFRPPNTQTVALYKTVFFDFWFRPANTQNWLPKICKKISYKLACMADRPEMFAPTRGFLGMADSMEPCEMLWGRPLLSWQRHLA